jgi:hypothetical protein
MHAGCYIDGKNNPVANLSEDEGAYLILTEKMKFFLPSKEQKNIPKPSETKPIKFTSAKRNL